jgi:DNA-binding IclR family transcriptional regulator
MESENKNHGLDLLKALRASAGRGGKVQIDMHDVCRATGLQEEDVRESLADLEHGGFITTEIICHIKKEWR